MSTFEKLSDTQIQRQDFVDNKIFDLLQALAPSDQELAWDIEMIGEVRDVVEGWLVDRLSSGREGEFYPAAH